MPAWTQNCTHRRTTVSHTLVHATYIRVPTKLIRKFRLISLIRDFITNPLKPPLVTFCISMFNITNSTFWPQMVFISLNCDNSVTTTASQQVSQQQHHKCRNNSVTTVSQQQRHKCHNNSVTTTASQVSQQQRHNSVTTTASQVLQQQRHNSVTTASPKVSEQQRHKKCHNNSATTSVTSVTTTASQQQCHNKCHNNSVTTQFFFYFSGETFKGFDAL